jgi:hypothetical protein
VKLFVQKAIGGSAIGLVAGGTIILCLSSLNRRFGKEENVVQVIAVFGLVYLNYFVADLICATSGVIATLIAGLSVKFFGRGAINNIHLMDEFFSITEHILNTILFFSWWSGVGKHIVHKSCRESNNCKGLGILSHSLCAFARDPCTFVRSSLSNYC